MEAKKGDFYSCEKIKGEKKPDPGYVLSEGVMRHSKRRYI